MSEDAPLTKKEERDEAEGYGSQDLKLSNFFQDWPKHIKRNDNGIIEAIIKRKNQRTNTAKKPGRRT
jgi:hypothetical protein